MPLCRAKLPRSTSAARPRTMPPFSPFNGTLRRLVLAFDVGTTFSGISYAVLDPGEEPKIQTVTRFPGQASGDFKIPSVLWYTKDGVMRSAGAEARDPMMRLEAEDDNLILAEWFKLHLRHDGLKDSDMKPLPPGKTVVQVIADFLSYLFKCAKTYILETHANGGSLWTSVGDRIDVVLSHPNGWDGVQQNQMRRAVVLAGLIPDTLAGHERVKFVTEGEASLHYCIDSGLADQFIRKGETVMMVDAGGGTVDLSSYTFTSCDPITVEEITATDCILEGSTGIDVRAKSFISEKLKHSKFGNPEDIVTMIEHFEKATKATFKDPADPSFVRFGSMRDRDDAVGIRSGQLRIEGADMAAFFEPSISAIVDAIGRQCAAATKRIKNAFLVGGFACSPWLFARLKDELAGMDIHLSRPDSHTNKAVAEGAISFELQKLVSSRVAKQTYGVICLDSFDPNNPEHVVRAHALKVRPSGEVCVRGKFDVLLEKGKKIHETEEASRPFNQEGNHPDDLDIIECEIMAYTGRNRKPEWSDVEPELFSHKCRVVANTSAVFKRQRRGRIGSYYRQDYRIVLSCGLTELKAHIVWDHNGVERRGPASIIYDEPVVVRP